MNKSLGYFTVEGSGYDIFHVTASECSERTGGTSYHFK
jgi:hypothetical protein